MLHSSLVKNLTENFVSADKADDVKSFFSANFNPAERTVQQGVESILLNEAWLKRDAEKIKAFLGNA